MKVYLVAVGRGRYELYSEPQDDSSRPSEQKDGLFQRVRARWHEWVERARHSRETGRIARLRDAMVCHLAETLAERQALRALREHREATLNFPSSIDIDQARRTLNDYLAHARTHHLRWLLIDLLLFAGSVVLAVFPGPNVIAYYLGFRLLVHIESWRGARHAMDQITWAFEPDSSLAELAGLASEPRDARASRVQAIAERLNLPRLSAFFDRVAV